METTYTLHAYVSEHYDGPECGEFIDTKEIQISHQHQLEKEKAKFKEEKENEFGYPVSVERGADRKISV